MTINENATQFQELLLALSQAKLHAAMEMVKQQGKAAGLTAREQLILQQTAKLAAAVIGISKLVHLADGPNAKDIVARLDNALVAVGMLGSTGLARDADILDESSAEDTANRLGDLVMAAVDTIMRMVHGLGEEIQRDENLLEAARAINAARS